MATQAVSPTGAEAEVRDPWLPMIVIAMGQMLMSFNVAAIPVSMGGMVESFDTPPTTVGTATVLYSLGVSAFIMPGEVPSGQPPRAPSRVVTPTTAAALAGHDGRRTP